MCFLKGTEMALNSAFSYIKTKRHLHARIGEGVLFMAVKGTIQMELDM